MGLLGKAKGKLTEQSGHFFEVKYKIDGIPYTEKVYGSPRDAKDTIDDLKASCKRRNENFQLISNNLKTK